MFEYHTGENSAFCRYVRDASPTCYRTPAVGSLRTASPLGSGPRAAVSTSLAVRSRLTTSASTKSTRPYIITCVGHLWRSRFMCYRSLHFGRSEIHHPPLSVSTYTVQAGSLLDSQRTPEHALGALSPDCLMRLAMVFGYPMPRAFTGLGGSHGKYNISLHFLSFLIISVRLEYRPTLSFIPLKGCTGKFRLEPSSSRYR